MLEMSSSFNAALPERLLHQASAGCTLQEVLPSNHGDALMPVPDQDHRRVLQAILSSHACANYGHGQELSCYAHSPTTL